MLSIGVFSRISKVTTNTLRYYDEIGLLKPIHVNSDNGYRYYDVKQLETILLINKLKLYSFSLEEIANVLKDPYNSGALFSLVTQKQHGLEEEMQQYTYILTQMKKDIASLERGLHLMSYLEDIQVKLAETQPQNILFIRKRMNADDYGKYMGKLYETIATEKLTPLGSPLCIYHDEEFSIDNFDAEIAIPVKEVVKGTRELPGCLCAMATLKGSYSELPSIYTKLKEWVDAEGYVVAASPYEVYMTDPMRTAPENYMTDVYFPIKKL